MDSSFRSDMMLVDPREWRSISVQASERLHALGSRSNVALVRDAEDKITSQEMLEVDKRPIMTKLLVSS